MRVYRPPAPLAKWKSLVTSDLLSSPSRLHRSLEILPWIHRVTCSVLPSAEALQPAKEGCQCLINLTLSPESLIPSLCPELRLTLDQQGKS